MDIRQLLETEAAERCFQEMSEERQKKIRTFHHREDRLRSLAAGMVMDRGLMAYDLREKDVPIVYGEYGKPCLKERQEIQFNLSHAGDYAVAGFGNKELGIDIEQIGRSSEKIASRFFTKEEQNYLMAISEKELRDKEFTKIWTKKESFVKAVGKGLSFGINQIETCAGVQTERINGIRSRKFSEKENEPLQTEKQKSYRTEEQELSKEQNWFFYEYELEGYQISVCSKETEISEEMEWVEI